MFLRLGSLLPLIVVVTGNDYYLFSGCAISTTLDKIIEDSLSLWVKYPPENEFSVTVTQDSIDHYLTDKSSNSDMAYQRWVPMDLVLRGSLELKFKNGTTWLSRDHDDVNNSSIKSIPEKSLYIPQGFLLDCPQEMPHWKVQKESDIEHVIIREGHEEVFSLVNNHETNLNIDVKGEESIRLCWNSDTNAMEVRRPSRRPCPQLPSFTVLWLRVFYRDQMIEISTSDSERHLMSFIMPDPYTKIAFNGPQVNGIVYVVHHLRGFPQEQSNDPKFVQSTDYVGSPSDTCHLMSVVGGISAFLIIVILCLLVVLFYNRWITSRQALFVLQKQDIKVDQKPSMNNGPAGGFGRKSSLPFQPAPRVREIVDNTYLTPRELKKLDDDDNDRPKSEHIYEDMIYIGLPKNKQSNESPSKMNLGYESPSGIPKHRV